ncbi:hypothetical protein SmJEL517_g04411 [Synchytrium microbalum]|uniref:Mediator complex subunit 9 n=1 Tax=Synchytrium microbalum TaxID=1806994 RepID=A0A507C3K4_9FUNG|nr:uncharacterized protein SmJEL517_g04411 [Synchytrium microbalum]TPX32536.1 hypothetical protein SmJEL517_g04411 [Synchytrium microbalum]
MEGQSAASDSTIVREDFTFLPLLHQVLSAYGDRATHPEQIKQLALALKTRFARANEVASTATNLDMSRATQQQSYQASLRILEEKRKQLQKYVDLVAEI